MTGFNIAFRMRRDLLVAAIAGNYLSEISLVRIRSANQRRNRHVLAAVERAMK